MSRLDEVNEWLDGSPYLLADEPGADRVAGLVSRLANLNEHARRALAELVMQLRGIVTSNHRVRELYESNRIEGVGPGLVETATILRSPDAQAITQAAGRFGLVRALTEDQRTYDVLGLHAAKLFAEELAASMDRPLTEAICEVCMA